MVSNSWTFWFWISPKLFTLLPIEVSSVNSSTVVFLTRHWLELKLSHWPNTVRGGRWRIIGRHIGKAGCLTGCSARPLDVHSIHKLEQLECLRSEDTPAASWLPTLLNHVGSQIKTRSNDLEDNGQGQRSSHATHFLMLVIICAKYGKNPWGTVDATERTRFSRPRPNDLEDIGQGQRSLYATHPLTLLIICAKYGKNPSRTADFFFQSQGRKISKICQKFKFSDFEKNITRDTP